MEMGWFFGSANSGNKKAEIVRANQLREGDYVRKINSGDKFSEVTIVQEIGLGHTNISLANGGGGCFFNNDKFERLV